MRSKAFYPCCGTDVYEPLMITAGMVANFVFCDSGTAHLDEWTRIKPTLDLSRLPRPTFIIEDARSVLSTIARFDVFFYRRDGVGEGGSGLYLLGKRLFPRILARFPTEGGLIITDGSNSGSGLFRKMLRPQGYSHIGWHFRIAPAPEQPFLDAYGLHVLEVKPKD